MELANSRFVPASQQRTWNKLIAPETLKVCITGCETLERVADNEYLVGLRADVGPVHARFKGRLKLTDMKPPHSYHLQFEGEGGPAGYAKGDADVVLEPEGEGTRFAYKAHADLGGKLAQLRPDQAEKIARKMTDNFFSLFSVCADKTFERNEQARVVKVPVEPDPVVAAHRSEMLSKVSWLVVPGVIMAIIAYHTFMH
ncbi:CoxG family protein [Pigmentiphaga litoralis]|uniref:CoxG family protein n=1 Tax=Pigmentiphaga litoralis TaxID=516702 RepID=UPI003B42E020